MKPKHIREKHMAEKKRKKQSGPFIEKRCTLALLTNGCSEKNLYSNSELRPAHLDRWSQKKCSGARWFVFIGGRGGDPPFLDHCGGEPHPLEHCGGGVVHAFTMSVFHYGSGALNQSHILSFMWLWFKFF